MTKLALAFVLFATAAAADVAVVDNNKKLKVDCAKDKEVSLIANNVTATLTGTCDLVTISGNNAKVIGSSQRFYIAGNENVVTAEVADEIHIAGNKNTVTYRQGATKATTKVMNPGKDNKVTRRP